MESDMRDTDVSEAGTAAHDVICAALSDIMGLSPPSIDRTRSLQDLGCDSLSLMRLASHLSQSFPVTLVAPELLAFPSIDALGRYLDTGRRMREILARWAALPIDRVTMESKLRDLGVDSLQIASLLALIESELGVVCDDEMVGRFLAARRVDELVAAVSHADLTETPRESGS
jgi:acyl carrier protein